MAIMVLIARISNNLFPHEVLSPEDEVKMRVFQELKEFHAAAYYETKDGKFKDKFCEVRDMSGLDKMKNRFLEDLEKYRVFTFDLKGHEPPEGLIVQCLVSPQGS